MLQRDNEIEKWNKFYKIGGISAILIVLLIPIQIFIFIKFPPPENTLGFFELFDKNWFLGLLSLDLLYIFNNTFLLLVYLGLFSALRHTNFAYMLIAIVIGLVGIAAYFSSTVCFEMLSLSKQYQLTESIEIKNQLIAAGHNFLATYKGTAFDIYYVFNAISLIIISRVMFKDKKFNKSEATWGLVSGILMIIPSTAGQIGLIFSMLSLIPWTIFSILISRRLFKLDKMNYQK